MRALRRRIQSLERDLQRLRGAMTDGLACTLSAEQLGAAAAAIWDVIEARYGSVSAIATEERLLEAAARVRAGARSDLDVSALAALPDWALRIFGVSAAEMLISVGTIDEWKHANEITDEALMAFARENR